MTRSLLWCMLCLCGAGLSLPARVEEPVLPMPVSHIAHTAEGNFTVYHRAPAEAQDLGLPFVPAGEMHASVVYRVRDHKERDLLYFAQASFTIHQSMGAVRRFYLPALGKGVAQETNVKTGVITLTAGEKDHFRLVAITPKGNGCDLLLEQVQQFTLPPRVFTAPEKRIIQLLDSVSATYRTARQVSYAMEQRTVSQETDKPARPARALSWKVRFTRPAQFVAVAGVNGVPGLAIRVDKGQMHVQRQMGMTEDRKITGRLTLDDLPEMQDDSVARLMLGESFVTPVLETLRQQPVTGVPPSEQTDMILTFPQLNETLHLIIDLRKKQILRSEMVVTEADETVTITRTYTQVTLLAVQPKPAPPKRASAVPRR